MAWSFGRSLEFFEAKFRLLHTHHSVKSDDPRRFNKPATLVDRVPQLERGAGVLPAEF
jgi:hypothetical protein